MKAVSPALHNKPGKFMFSHKLHISHLLAKRLFQSVRLSLGWDSSEEDIDRAASLLIDAWENLT